MNVWYHELADLLLKICSNIDSFFKWQYKVNDNLNTKLRELLKAEKRKNPNIHVFEKIFNNPYNLKNKEVIVLINGDELQPFEKWEQKDGLKWWSAYNDIKH